MPILKKKKMKYNYNRYYLSFVMKSFREQKQLIIIDIYNKFSFNVYNQIPMKFEITQTPTQNPYQVCKYINKNQN